VAEDRDALRASDKDREFVADRLREALNEGRLDLTEYDDRLRDAYAARTYGDLKGLLSDLPAVAPTSRSQVVPSNPLQPPAVVPTQPPGGTVAQWVFNQWSGWLGLAVILTAIWLISGHGDYWPVWPLGIWGVFNLLSTINGLSNGQPRKDFERHQRRQVEREARKAAEHDRIDPSDS
jgi:hypothetical protein